MKLHEKTHYQILNHEIFYWKMIIWDSSDWNIHASKSKLSIDIDTEYKYSIDICIVSSIKDLHWGIQVIHPKIFGI